MLGLYYFQDGTAAPAPAPASQQVSSVYSFVMESSSPLLIISTFHPLVVRLLMNLLLYVVMSGVVTHTSPAKQGRPTRCPKATTATIRTITAATGENRQTPSLLM